MLQETFAQLLTVEAPLPQPCLCIECLTVCPRELHGWGFDWFPFSSHRELDPCDTISAWALFIPDSKESKI